MLIDTQILRTSALNTLTFQHISFTSLAHIDLIPGCSRSPSVDFGQIRNSRIYSYPTYIMAGTSSSQTVLSLDPTCGSTDNFRLFCDSSSAIEDSRSCTRSNGTDWATDGDKSSPLDHNARARRRPRNLALPAPRNINLGLHSQAHEYTLISLPTAMKTRIMRYPQQLR
jgi:hypothetical protein